MINLSLNPLKSGQGFYLETLENYMEGKSQSP